jgi:hypothetical protein
VQTVSPENDPVVAEFMAVWFPEDAAGQSGEDSDDAEWDWEAEHSFLDTVRMMREWDDAQFDRIVPAARALIANGVYPDQVADWDGIFHSGIDLIIGMTQHPAFKEDLARSGVEDPDTFLAQRTAVLRELQTSYDQSRRNGAG